MRAGAPCGSLAHTCVRMPDSFLFFFLSFLKVPVYGQEKSLAIKPSIFLALKSYSDPNVYKTRVYIGAASVNVVAEWRQMRGWRRHVILSTTLIHQWQVGGGRRTTGDGRAGVCRGRREGDGTDADWSERDIQGREGCTVPPTQAVISTPSLCASWFVQDVTQAA